MAAAASEQAKAHIEDAAPDSAHSLAQRPVLANYDRPTLDQLLAITSACVIIAYGIYTVSMESGAVPSCQCRWHGAEWLLSGGDFGQHDDRHSAGTRQLVSGCGGWG